MALFASVVNVQPAEHSGDGDGAESATASLLGFCNDRVSLWGIPMIPAVSRYGW